MIRVLVAEDSPTARALLVSILSSDPEVQVVGEAENGMQAVEMAQKLRPDVVTMDIRMPRMDGFEATKEIMITAPTPIVIVTSSMATDEVEMSMYALRSGALAILTKPIGPSAPGFDEAARQLLAHVKSMAQVKVVRHWRPTKAVSPTKTEPQAEPSSTRPRVIAIGTSTGGPAALHAILSGLPRDFPVPILIVQHISVGFASGLADWLNKAGELRVKLAEEAEPLQPGTAYLAPDDRHLGVSPRGKVALSAGLIGGFRPSATYLFQSVAQVYGTATVAIVLTGMGEDGVEGLRAVRKVNGRILAQDEKTSVVFGMPAATIAAGLADKIVSLDHIAAQLIDFV